MCRRLFLSWQLIRAIVKELLYDLLLRIIDEFFYAGIENRLNLDIFLIG